MKKYLVFLGLLVSVVLIAVSGCTVTSTTNNPAPAPSGTTSIEVGSGGSVTLSAGENSGTASILVVDQDNDPVNSTDNLNINNMTVKIWSTTDTTTQTATVGTLTYTGGSSGSDISYALTLDRSGSMYASDIASLEAASSAFVANSSAADEGMIINFDDVVAIDQDLTTNKSLLNAAITGESVSGGTTALYASVNTGIATLSADGTNARKAVIAMTDGYNNEAPTSISDPIGKAQAAGIPVYTVGLGSASTSSLQQLATDTGGLFYAAPSAADLVDLYNKISSALGSSWSVTFTSSTTFVTSTTYYILVTVTYEDGISNSVLFTVTI